MAFERGANRVEVAMGVGDELTDEILLQCGRRFRGRHA
jgi:hypothetical protein